MLWDPDPAPPLAASLPEVPAESLPAQSATADPHLNLFVVPEMLQATASRASLACCTTRATVSVASCSPPPASRARPTPLTTSHRCWSRSTMPPRSGGAPGRCPSTPRRRVGRTPACWAASGGRPARPSWARAPRRCSHCISSRPRCVGWGRPVALSRSIPGGANVVMAPVFALGTLRTLTLTSVVPGIYSGQAQLCGRD